MDNILFLHKCFVKSGGIERVHTNLANGLKSVGKNPYFFVLDGFGESEEGFQRLAEDFPAERVSSELSFYKRLEKLWAFISKHQIQGIISATETANMFAFLTKIRFPKLKVIYTRHCAFDVSDQKLSPFAIKLLYSLFAFNGAVVGVSKSLRDQIKQAVVFKRKPIEFIPNAVISDEILLKAEKSDQQWPEKKYFVAIGRLVEQKGFDLLLPAYASAANKDADLPDLVIIGEGKDEHELIQQAASLGIAEKVIFAGFTTNPYYPIKNAQAFILSSRHEGMPTVLIESLSLNTPVIAFDCPTGPAEIIQHEENGFLVKHLDINALSFAILNWQQLPTENLANGVSNFTFEAVANAYHSMLEKA
ncbi:glycosyltransferase [Glaciecola sp. 1036]|uniref:glycosyltransferase n=1 Tax=Alteromonadaceae TaxID=72275 RepID=UPI003D05E2B6